MRPEHVLPKGQHEFIPAQPALDTLKGTGYVETQTKAFQEYPKYIDGRIVNSAAEESALAPVKAEAPADPDDVSPKPKPAPFGKK